MKQGRLRIRPQLYGFVYAAIALLVVMFHQPLFDLPYYWDELGQFIPASLDLYQTGAWIPHSTIPNVHPPGVMAYLAGFWHIFGYSIAGTRIAMLLMASLGALFTFLLAIELGRGVPGTPAFAALTLLCLSPLFFAQSMLAQLDMPAMCFTAGALLLFVQDRIRASALVCVALVLMKETGVVAPAVFGGWLLLERRAKEALWFVLPFVALGIWLAALKSGTGHWFGNRAFTDYNLFYPLHPARFSVALLRRAYYLFVSTGHFVGTATLVWAYRRMPLFRERSWRIAGAFFLAHVLAVCALGGAVLERYLLPVLPILYIAFAMAMQALLPRPRKWTLGALFACLIAANFVNPPYPFPFENNLAFAGFVDLQAEAAAAVDLRQGTIATAFPMADALRRPEYGYVSRGRPVTVMAGFRSSDIAALKNKPDLMIVFDPTWDPWNVRNRSWYQSTMRNLYGYERWMSPEEIAVSLDMRIHKRWQTRGLSMTLLVR